MGGQLPSRVLGGDAEAGTAEGQPHGGKGGQVSPARVVGVGSPGRLTGSRILQDRSREWIWLSPLALSWRRGKLGQLAIIIRAWPTGADGCGLRAAGWGSEFCVSVRSGHSCLHIQSLTWLPGLSGDYLKISNRVLMDEGQGSL